MNLRIFFLLLILNSFSYSQIFVSPYGDDTNPGTIELPFRTISKAVSLSGPDSLIYLRGGIYYDSTTIRLNKSGQSGRYIRLWAYPGEKPIVDFSGQPVSTSSRGFQITYNYWYLKGLTIRYAKDNGIHISSWYNKVENCIIYGCNDTGLQISNGGSYNIITNCDSYENVDYLTNGENADGFAPKLGVGPGNEFHGCRAWSNSDDGWDLWQADTTVLIDNCWAFRNGFNIWNISSFQGDGNGFKLGGDYYSDPHLITRSIAFDNKSKGFDQNNNTAGITVYNNTAFRNQSRNYSFPTAPLTGVHILKNNISYSGQNLIASNSILETNSWQGFNLTNSDFLSLDTSLATIGRDSLGVIPDTVLFRLSPQSALINAGVNVGLPYNDAAPDIGAFETPGIPVSVDKDAVVVSGFNLKQNFPNPFNPSTKFVFSLEKPGEVHLEVFDILGRKLSSIYAGFLNSGSYEILWYAEDNFGHSLPAGIYFVKLQSGKVHKTIKITLVK